jgi:hypothetical protein
VLKIDRPFEGLEEVWVWRPPHPADPEEPEKFHRITRIGTLDGAALVGRVQVRTRPSRTVLGAVEDLEGLGPWRRTKLGKANVLRSGEPRRVRGAVVRSGKVEAYWKPGGHFQIGDREELNQIATAGRPYPPSVRELGESALAAGRSLLRRVRDRNEPGPEAELPAEAADAPGEQPTEPVELTAFDGWLRATQVEVAGEPTWRIVIDPHPGAPESVGLGVVLAAVALVHRSG